jgi:hypothetical protein
MIFSAQVGNPDSGPELSKTATDFRKKLQFANMGSKQQHPK